LQHALCSATSQNANFPGHAGHAVAAHHAA
jgi:hypothetical protein